MTDARWSIEAIRPLVTHENPTGRHLVVTFSCPVSRRHVNARWTAPQSSGVAAQVAGRVQQSAWYEVRRQAQSMVRSVLGGGSLGQIAGSAVDAAIGAHTYAPSARAAQHLSTADRDRGVVEAFKTVASQFAWVQGRWVYGAAAKDLLSPLDRQLQEAPLASGYDRQLAARMLVEVALAHGGVSAEEQSHLEDTLDPQVGSLQALAQRPPLSRAELGEATKGPVRVSLLALAWTLALVDERFDAAEQAKLEGFAAGLQLSPADRARARDLARGWLMDQAFERAFGWGGHDAHARAEAMALGERIGMTQEEVEVAEAKFQRRRAG